MEGEGSKVRLVRCPKCQNVLPELLDFSFYKCGACGALLTANNQGSRSGDLFEKSDDEKGKGASEKEKHICDKTISLIDRSSSKAEDKVFVKAMDQTSRAEAMNLHHKQGNQGDGVFFDGGYNTYSRGRFDNRVHENDHVENAKWEFSNFSHPHGGSSNYRSNFPHDFGEHKRVENLEHDRAELLRMIDELEIQLGSSSDAREKPRDIGLINRTMDHHLYIHNPFVPEGPRRENLQPFATDQNVLDSVYGYYKHGHASNMGNIGPANRVVRSSNRQPYHDQFSGFNISLNQNEFSGYNMGLNQKIPALQNFVGSANGPQCSCFRCYRNWQIQSRVQQTTVKSTQHNINSSYGLHGHNLGSSSDFDFDNGILNGGLMRRAVITHGSKKVCHPRAGGAPFLACPSCFVLLELPKNLTRGKGEGKKIRCGACSELLLVKLENSVIVITIPTKLRQVSTKDVKNLDDYLEVNECDNSTVNSQSPNVDRNALSRDHSVKSGRSRERQGMVSSFSSFSEDEESPDNVIIVRENSKPGDLALKDNPPLRDDSSFADLPSKDDSPPPFPHHPQNLEPDEDFADFVFSRCGMGNRSKRASRQNSKKGVPMVTEKEMVYSDVAVSAEVSEEEDQPTLQEESESFFGGFFKKGIKNLLRPDQTVDMSRINVFVNGQPLSNRVVWKAEKLAGPIQPGNYWYDYRAGFWGVMGQPCHGIIPPFIKEFSYSMPRNCSAGNTGVFVNGRELHESDLDLLASRGLPTTRNKFYLIEISGRVVDEYTGEELDDLGKLAPTVEKVKRGFGMRPTTTVE